MAQNITIKIAGKEFPLVAPSPEMEQLERMAADAVNKRLEEYSVRYPHQELADKLSIAAFQEAANRISLQRRIAALEKEVEQFRSETSQYLENLKK